jgi:cell division protein FtsN
MSEKPSLYVVEKKEVIILVVLFVLVTVLSFTMGVRYGESVGKKSAREQSEAEQAAGTGESELIGGKLSEPETSKPEVAGHGANPEEAAAPKKNAAPPAKESVDKNSDEFLLNALKDTAVEPPGGKAPNEAKLPDDVKRIPGKSYVVQVGSHPTRSEAESQVRQLKAKKVDAEILPPAVDKQGQWHRVIVGSFKTKREAEKEASALKGRGAILSYYVWRLP